MEPKPISRIGIFVQNTESFKGWNLSSPGTAFTDWKFLNHQVETNCLYLFGFALILDCKMIMLCITYLATFIKMFKSAEKKKIHLYSNISGALCALQLFKSLPFKKCNDKNTQKWGTKIFVIESQNMVMAFTLPC